LVKITLPVVWLAQGALAAGNTTMSIRATPEQQEHTQRRQTRLETARFYFISNKCFIDLIFKNQLNYV
jgi:hypothetical protein